MAEDTRLLWSTDVQPAMVLVERAYGELRKIVEADRELGKYVATAEEYRQIHNSIGTAISLLKGAMNLTPIGPDFFSNGSLAGPPGVEGPPGKVLNDLSPESGRD